MLADTPLNHRTNFDSINAVQHRFYVVGLHAYHSSLLLYSNFMINVLLVFADDENKK